MSFSSSPPIKRFFFVVLAILCVAPAAFSQQGGNRQNQTNQAPANAPKSNRPQPVAVWKVELPGGSYMVARSAINAISSQQYLVDGAARVTEVNISTSGVFQPRFYYIEPLGVEATENVPASAAAGDQARTAVETAADAGSPDASDAVWSKVVKNYPATTHAGTIEFRLESLEQLQDLLDSDEHAWMTGRSEVFTVDGTKPYHYKAKVGDSNEGGSDPSSNDAGSDTEDPN